MPAGTTKTETNNTPWPGVKKILNTGFRDAIRLYQGGYGQNLGSNVVPMSDDTRQANNMARRLAERNIGGGLSQQYQKIINRGGYNKEMQTAVNRLRGIATSNYKPTDDFESVLGASLRDAGNAVDENAAAAGRYGSGIHEGVKERELGDLSSRARLADYNDWQNRRDSAISQLGNIGQAGIGNLGAGYEGMQSPIRTKLGIGAQYEDLMRRQIEDRNRVLNEPWSQLNKLMSTAGYGSGYGSSTTLAPGPNPLLQGLGTGAAGLGILGALGIL